MDANKMWNRLEGKYVVKSGDIARRGGEGGGESEEIVF
jgi:hypothetical protein